MVAALHTHQIAHGDLQDGNILLKRNGTDVEIKLIDYDSLYVPALRGQPEQIVGLPEYQHPKRMIGGGQANEKVDYFSELVIYLSFLSLSEKPELWNRFKDKTERGLLFSKKDFENPDQSDIFQELEKLSPDVQQLAATLKDFCAKTSIDELEPLEAILPKDARSHYNQGESLRKNNRYNEALAEFQKAIDIKPDYARAYFGRGHVYRRTKQDAKAISEFQQAIKFEPNYKEAHYGLAIAYFESGDNSKAKASANAALKIDPSYQPVRQLLDVIKSPLPPVPPKPKPQPPDPTPDPIINLWQYITGVVKHTTAVVKNKRHYVTTGALGLALVVCCILFLMQISAKNAVLLQKTELTEKLSQKESEIRQQELEIQGLTSSVQTLESANQKLIRDNGELERKLNNRTSTPNTPFGYVTNLRSQLNNQKHKNQELQTQLIKKNTEIRQLRNDKTVTLTENQKLKKQLIGSNQEIADQNVTIHRLRKEKTEIRTENQGLQDQLAGQTSEVFNLTDRVRQLQKEKVEIQRQNQNLQGENGSLTRQNRDLHNKNATLLNQLDKAKQRNAEGIVDPEPPKKIQYDRNIGHRARSHNNQGVIAFNRKDYNKAIGHFRTTIRADSNLEVAYYNLGCTFLKIKEYDNAISAFNKAIALNQRFKEAYYNRSLTYFRTDMFQKAKQDVQKALRIDSNYRLAQRLLTAIENAQQ